MSTSPNRHRLVDRSVAVALVALAVFAAPAAAQDDYTDPYLWLEEIRSERVMEWVHEQNRETLDALASRPLYDSLYQRTLAILSSEERIAYPRIMGDRLYNFWTDDEHPRGIWRRTTWASYRSGDPAWETVLDIDSLAAAEGVNWAFHGAVCRPPAYRRCLVRLSRGGADAVQIREFSLATERFIEDGFFLEEAKTSVAWSGRDTLLVATDFGPGSLTTSGYPRVVKRWARGEPLAEAEVLFEADSTDMGVWVGTMRTAGRDYHVIVHRPSFFKANYYLLQDGEPVRVDLPRDADPGLLGEQLLLYLRSDWTVGGRTYPQGALIAIDRSRFLEGARDFEVVVEPGPRTVIEGFSTTRDYVLVEVLDDVRGELWRYRLVDGEWVGEQVPAPDFGTISVVSTAEESNRYFFNYQSFLQPTTLYLAANDSVRPVRELPAMFNAEGLVVRQHEAVSKDGTRIPYFVVRPKGLEFDGENPTLLYGYGGFQISLTPNYSATVGSAWLERGGVYVVANIRGGGEFGPSWHRAAMKEHRQRAYDDFLAVAEDLVARGLTSPDHLGIMGGSNGGLLVGVAFTQRPELFDAVVSSNPLLDMRRYNELLAGASWMAEYGNPDDPEDWAYIREYSPYHNLEPDADYPRVLLTTTTRDDRVHPAHARKMAAKMEAMGHPVYFFENTEGGHGAGVTPEQRARKYALIYTYLWTQLRD